MILGQCKGQLYSYPAKRWKKKKRLAFMNTECKKTFRRRVKVRVFNTTFNNDLRQVGGFLRVLRFPPPITLTATI
jgi:hypothetical protein